MRAAIFTRNKYDVVVFLIFAAWFPTPVWAQAGDYVKPWIAYGEEFDDNVLNSTQSRQSDVVTRVTSGVELGYRSEPFTLLGSYDFSSEIFAQHPRLTQAQARQHGGLRFGYRPTRLWTLGFVGDYIESERPQDLNTTTGIGGERGRSRGYELAPELIYRINPLTTAIARYGFSHNERPQGVTVGVSGLTSNAENDRHDAEFALARELTSRDKGLLAYGFRHFTTGGTLLSNQARRFDDSLSSQVLSLGWTRELSSLMMLNLRGGPRFSRGEAAPEVEGSLSRRFHHGEAMFTYGRTQNIAVGRSGPVETESYLGSINYQVLPRFLVRANPGYHINEGENFTTKVYRLDLNASYAISPWLLLQGQYRFSFERESGRLPGSSGRGDRLRNVVFVELTVAPQYRLW